MRLLTLVRHAKAVPGHAELDDFDRPLHARGQRDAVTMAACILEQLPRPRRLVSSPALRAITTARHFAGALKFSAGELLQQPDIYEASAGTLLSLVQMLNDADDHIMLFGHNPGFSQLAQLLAEDQIDEMPTCAVVHLQLRIAAWSEAAPDCGKLLKTFYPEDPTL